VNPHLGFARDDKLNGLGRKKARRGAGLSVMGKQVPVRNAGYALEVFLATGFFAFAGLSAPTAAVPMALTRALRRLL